MSAPLLWLECRGRNGFDHPLAIPDDMAAEAVNVVFLESGLAQRRPGTEDVSVTVASGAWAGIGYLAKYVPPAGLATAQLLLVTTDASRRVLAGTTGFVFTNLTLPTAGGDPETPTQVSSAQLNNKLFLAYADAPAGSVTNRLVVYDPVNAAGILTFAGLAQPAVVTVGNTGAGTYPATPRWYREQARTKVGSLYLRVSELSTAVAFTPSGTGTAARVTKGTVDATTTHWALYASADSVNGPYYQIAETVVGTTTYDDSALPSTYNTGTVAPLEGSNVPFPCVKFLASDGNRLIGFGVHATAAGNSLTPTPGRVYFTPVMGSSGRGDDERIESTVETEGWIDLTPGGAGGEDRGLSGPLNGEFYAFQSKGIYRLVPTNQAEAPFARHQVTQHAGSLSNLSQILAEDETGAQCIYFLNPADGPRRIGFGGSMQWIGRDVYDLWLTVNQNATTVKAWGLYDDVHKRILWFVAGTAANAPTLILMYDVTKGRADGQIVRYGWAQWTGLMATWQTGVMFPLAGGNVEVPYGSPSGTALLERQPIPSLTADPEPTPTYRAYLQSKAFDLDPSIARRKRITEAYLSGVAAAATITQTVTKDWGLETFTETVSLAQAGSESRVRRRLEAIDVADVVALQITLGDAVGLLTPNPIWTIDRWVGMVEIQDGAK